MSTITIPGKALKAIAGFTGDGTRAVLNSVVIGELDGHVPALMACDSYRLVQWLPRNVGYNVAWTRATAPGQVRRILPRFDTDQAITLAGTKGNVDITWTARGWEMEAAGVTLMGKFVDGEYPNTAQLWPVVGEDATTAKFAVNPKYMATIANLCTTLSADKTVPPMIVVGTLDALKPSVMFTSQQVGRDTTDGWSALSLLMPVRVERDPKHGSTELVKPKLEVVKGKVA